MARSPAAARRARGYVASLGGVSASKLVSASVRTRQGTGSAMNTTANNFTAAQVVDKTNARVSNVRGMIWNGNRSQNSAAEYAGGYPLYYCYSIIPDPNTASLYDQTGKQQIFATWTAAATDQQVLRPNGQMGSALVKPDGSAGTFAEFTAAGGLIQTVSGNPTITVPQGWGAFYDPIAAAMPAGRKYIHRVVYSGPASTSAAIVHNLGGIGAVGDYQKPAASHGATLINTANWSGVAGATVPTTVLLPQIIYGEGDAGVLTVWADGDSIMAGEPGDGLGDADGVCGVYRRALNIRGLPFVCTAVPSTKASQVNALSLPFRDIIAGIASALVTNYGHNEEGLAWGNGALAPAPNGDGLFWAIHRNYYKTSRTKMRSGARVVPCTLTPTQSGGINGTAGSAGTAVSSLTSSGTVATATFAAAHGRSVGEVIQIYSAEVTGYNGNVVVASVPSTTTLTYTLPAGATGLAATTTASKMATGVGSLADSKYVNVRPWMIRSGAFTGVAFDPTLGDPDAAADLYGIVGDRNLFTGGFATTQDGTHLLGNNTSGVTNPAAMNDAATALAALLAPALGL